MAKSRNVANLIAANLLPASDTIVTSMIADGAITTAKLANTAVTTSKLDSGVIAQFPVVITNVIVTDSSYTTQADTAIAPGGGYVKLIGSGFLPGVQVYVNNTPAIVSTYVSATEVRAQVTSLSTGYYHIYVQNSNGQAGLRVNGLYVSGSPTWTTSSSIGSTVNVPFGIQLVATSDTPVTYSLAAGSTLPTGLSLTALGYLSGTVSGLTQTTTYTIGIVATDAENQSNTRTFTLTITVSEPYFPYTSLLLSGNNAGTTTQNNTFIDTSLAAITPTRFGNTTQGSFGPFSQTGWSYFNSSASNPIMTYPTGTFNYFGAKTTIECWVFPTNLSGGTNNCYNILTNQDSGGSAGQVQFGLISSNGTTFSLTIYSTVTNDNATSTITGNIAQWSHICVQIDATTPGASNQIVFSINGITETTTRNYTGMTSTSYPSTALSVGGNGYYSGYFQGYMSNLRVVKTSDYVYGTSNFTPPTSALTAVTGTVLLTCQSNRFVDNSASPNTLTVGGGTPSIQSFSPFSPTSLYLQNNHGGSIYLDGTGDYLSMGYSGLALTNATTPFTIEAWVYMRAAGGCLLSNELGTNIHVCIGFSAGTTGFNDANSTGGRYIAFGFYNGSAWNQVVSNAQVTLNTWCHIACVYTGLATKIYLNGTDVTSGTLATWTTLVGTSNYFVGRRWDLLGTPYFTGYISDLRAIKGAAAYTGNFTPPVAPLLTSQSSSGNVAAVTSGLTTLLLKGTNAGVFDGTAKNVVETIGSVATQTTVYKYGGASIYFPGTASFLFAPSSPGFAFGTGDYTIECWIYLSVLGTYRRIWWFGDDNDNTNVNASNQIQFGGASQTAITGSTLSVNTWYHLAYVRSSGSGKLYLDGAQVGSTTSNSYNSAARSFYIGATNTGANPWSGYIDDFRVTKGVARFTANFTPATSELTAN